MTIQARIRPLVPEDLLRGVDHLGRTAFVAAQAAFAGAPPRAGESIAAERWQDDRITPALTRAATSPASTTSSGWAGSLAAQAVFAFIESLAPQSAAAKLIDAGLMVSLDGIASVNIPSRVGAPGADVAFVGEGAPIPARRFNLQAVQLGPKSKLAAIVPITREVAEHANGEAVMGTLLREDFAASLDAAVFSTAAASSVRPAGLLHGVTPITAASGGDDAALVADLTALGAAVARAGASSDPIFVAAPEQALKLSLRPAAATPLTVWSTPGLAAGTVVAIEPRAFVSGFGSIPTIKVSREAIIHADTAPAQIGVAGTPNVVAAPTVNAFQSDLVLLACILDCAWAMRGQGTVAYITGATW